MNERLASWLFFLINPFIAMLLAFKDYTQPYAKNIFWAFCTFFGLTFAVGKESHNSDVTRYVSKLENMYKEYHLSINEAIQNFNDSKEVDVFQDILVYLLSRITDNQAILIMIFGFIFGFFYSRNIWYVFGLLEGKLSLIVKLLLFALILVVPIWNINGIRMYLAFHVFIYGLLPFIFEHKKSKIVFIFLSFFIHFSYIVPISIFLIYLFAGNRLNLYFFVFIFSLFISEFDINPVNQFIGKFVPESILERSDSYRNETVVEAYRENIKVKKVNWYVKWHKIALRWSLWLLIFYLYRHTKTQIIAISGWGKLFSLALLFFSVANIFSSLPSGSRFYIFGDFLTLILVILYFNQYNYDYKFKNILQKLSPFILLFIVISVRLGIYSMSITTIIGNPFIAIFNAGETTSLNDLIK